MYCAKQRARVPFVTAWLATVQVGSEIFDRVRPDFCASPLIAAGVMSGVPVICSHLRLVATVLLPCALRMIAATPKAISTTPAATPPSSRMRFIFLPPFRFRGLGGHGAPAWAARHRGRRGTWLRLSPMHGAGEAAR